MAHVTESDYKKLAEAVANDLVHNAVPLNDSITKLAKSMDLSHEQVKRLCESANNHTFNQLFQNKGKEASDRIVEFDVADADKILNSHIKEAAYTAHEDNLVYLNDYASLEDTEFNEASVVKTASEEVQAPARVKEADVRTLRKTLSYLRQEKIATELSVEDGMQALKSRFKRLYTDLPFEAFEKGACALYGEDAIGVVSELRTQLRMPAVSYNLDVLQKTAGYVDDSAFEFALLSTVIADRNRLNKVAAAIKLLEGSL